MTAIFGVAGNGDLFYTEGHKASEEMPEWLSAFGLDAYEYQCGNGVRIGETTAKKIRAKAEEKNIINKDEYMKKDVFMNTEGEIVSSVCDSLSSLMNDGFVSLLNFSSFSYLPPSKLEWNVFLLESIILASNRFDLFQGSVTDRRYVKSIVAEKGRYSSYAELVAELLIKRGKNTISERELKDILVINNLHLGKIPAEITNSEIFSYKDDLWHVVLDGHKA